MRNDAARNLLPSYRDLESKVEGLHAELELARAERLRQREEKQRLAERLRNLLELLPGGVVVLDGANAVREFSPAAAEILGLPLAGEQWPAVCARAFRSASPLRRRSDVAERTPGQHLAASARRRARFENVTHGAKGASRRKAIGKAMERFKSEVHRIDANREQQQADEQAAAQRRSREPTRPGSGKSAAPPAGK